MRIKTHLVVPSRWDRWQATPTSLRLLPLRARQEGYTVLRVPEPLREAFCELARVFTLYDRLFQHPRRILSAEQLAAFRVWHEATQALITALQARP